MRTLRAEYFQSVKSHAEEVTNLVKNEGMDLGDALHQVVHGSYWVIYTHANFQVLMCSDHYDAYSEEFGEPAILDSDINWAALAYAAMERDVSEEVGEIEPGEVEEAPRHRVQAQDDIWYGDGPFEVHPSEHGGDWVVVKNGSVWYTFQSRRDAIETAKAKNDEEIR